MMQEMLEMLAGYAGGAGGMLVLAFNAGCWDALPELLFFLTKYSYGLFFSKSSQECPLQMMQEMLEMLVALLW